MFFHHGPKGSLLPYTRYTMASLPGFQVAACSFHIVSMAAQNRTAYSQRHDPCDQVMSGSSPLVPPQHTSSRYQRQVSSGQLPAKTHRAALEEPDTEGMPSRIFNLQKEQTCNGDRNRHLRDSILQACVRNPITPSLFCSSASISRSKSLSLQKCGF
jgi:hypothetical protein